MNDVIAIEGLRVPARVGVYPHERDLRQPLIVDIRMATDTAEAGRNDDVRSTIDYARVASIVRDVVASRHHKLVESVAEGIAEQIFVRFPGRLAHVWVAVSKPHAVVEARCVRVEIVRYPPES